MSLRDMTVGVLGGALAVGASLLAGALTGEETFAVLALLAVALVALGMGAAAAVWTYAVAGTATIAQAIVTPDRLVSSADMVRVVVLMIGAPLVVLIALILERQRQASLVERDLSAAAEQVALSERAAADDARRELQVALDLVERERARLEEVAEAIPEPLIVYGPDGRGTYANRAAMRTFGRSFYDRPVEEFGRLALPRDDRGVALDEADWPQVRGRREAFRRRIVVRLPMSARDLVVDVEGTPIPDGGCVLLLRDVGREVADRRRLSRFASFVAHELRNPLAVAKARIELGNRATDIADGAPDHGVRALESVDAAIGILERLELFSRAEAGGLEAEVGEFDLRHATEAAVERLRARGSNRSVTIKALGDTVLAGDRQLTEQAITNLLTNADRYSVEGGGIEIEIGGTVPEVRVRDEGPGISDELAEVIFQERVSSGRGLGLGLFLVHAAMEAQGGSVELEERSPAAVFLLRWPRRDGDRAAAGAAPGASVRD